MPQLPSLNTILELKKSNLLYVPILFDSIRSFALIDTGAFACAMPNSLYQQISENHPRLVTKLSLGNNASVRVANRQTVNVLCRVAMPFRLSSKCNFSAEFLILPEMNSVILGMPFFEENDIKIDLKARHLLLPDETYQINTLQKDDGSFAKLYPDNTCNLATTQKIHIYPNSCEIVTVSPPKGSESNFAEKSGRVEPEPKYEMSTSVCISSSLNVLRGGQTQISILNLNPYPITIPKDTVVAKFSLLTLEESEHLKPVPLEFLSFPEAEFQNCLNALFDGANLTPYEPANREWYPTPENCKNPEQLNPLERRIYDEISKFRELEKSDPQSSETDKNQFLQQFHWEKTLFSRSERAEVENILVEFCDIFAKHRLDVGCNEHFKVKLTPEHHRPIYTQSPPTPIHLRDELMVELALMQHYGIITPLPYSKYCSPIFAQRKPSGKLRLLIDLRRINHLIRHDYHQNNFPISTMVDAKHHLAGKKFFTKLDCSQAYFALQMADPLSVELLAFNFNSRTFAFQRLAQGLSRSVSAFSSFVREYLDPCIAADKCFSYVDDIGSATNTSREMIDNIRHIFQCVRRSGLKLSPSKCEFGVPEIKFLGNTIGAEGMSPNREKVEKFISKLKMPQNRKQVKRFIGFLQFFRSFLPNLSEKLVEFNSLLRHDVEFVIKDIHRSRLEQLKKDLIQACDVHLHLPLPGRQYVIMADASYYAAGYVLMMETQGQQDGERKTYAPVSFGSRIFGPAQLKLSIYAKEFLAVYYSFDTFAHILWGSEKPTVVLTDNKSLTRFFQAKTIPATLWTSVDRLMSFSFVLGHIPGVANLAADYLSRMHINPADKVKLKISEKIPIVAVEFELEPKTPDNSLTELDYVTELAEVQPAGKRLISDTDFVITNFTVFDNASVNSLELPNPLDTYDFSESSEPLELAVEQDRDENVRKVKEWLSTKIFPDPKYLTPELKKYLKHKNRLIVKNNVLYRQFYAHNGSISHLQFCVPKQLRKELLYRIHNSRYRGHQGITNTIAEFRQNFYFPMFTEQLIDYVRNCISCQQLNMPKNASVTPPMESVIIQQSLPGDCMQIDLVGKMPSNQGYTHILSAIDVFTKYLFATPLKKADAETVARSLINIFMKHSYIPLQIISDLGTVFTSEMMQKLTEMLEIELKHATLKHPQTIGLLERQHGPLKRYLRLYENSTNHNWHNHVDIATFIHNTSYNPIIGCSPSKLFHGRDPYTPLNLRFRVAEKKIQPTTFDYLNDLQESLSEAYSTTKENLYLAYLKYRSYYDKKADAEPLTQNQHCLLLNPRIGEEPVKLKLANKYLPLYRVEKVLTHSNYLIRKVNTNFTQCVHRIRLKPIKPQFEVTDLTEIDPKNFVLEPGLHESRLEPALSDNMVPQLLTQPELTLRTSFSATVPSISQTQQPTQTPQPALGTSVVSTEEPEQRQPRELRHRRHVFSPERLLPDARSARYRILRRKIRQVIAKRKTQTKRNPTNEPEIRARRRIVPDSGLDPVLELPSENESDNNSMGFNGEGNLHQNPENYGSMPNIPLHDDDNILDLSNDSLGLSTSNCSDNDDAETHKKVSPPPEFDIDSDSNPNTDNKIQTPTEFSHQNANTTGNHAAGDSIQVNLNSTNGNTTQVHTNQQQDTTTSGLPSTATTPTHQTVETTTPPVNRQETTPAVPTNQTLTTPDTTLPQTTKIRSSTPQQQSQPPTPTRIPRPGRSATTTTTRNTPPILRPRNRQHTAVQTRITTSQRASSRPSSPNVLTRSITRGRVRTGVRRK